jgi:subtilase family serine protease
MVWPAGPAGARVTGRGARVLCRLISVASHMLHVLFLLCMWMKSIIKAAAILPLAALVPVVLAVAVPKPAADAASAHAASGTSVATDCDSLATCYTPGQLQAAYGVRQLLVRGTDGQGQTVVLPELAEEQMSPPTISDIRQDLRLFDGRFGLPAARLKVDAKLAGQASPWLAKEEEVQDAEIVHAIAPDATILVVLLPSTALASTATATADLTAALRLGASEGDVISVSAGWGEHCFTSAEVASMHQALQAAADRHVTVVAGSGDTGAVSRPCLGSAAPGDPVREVSMPASDPLVLAVGGTTLTASHQTGAYVSETTWTDPAASRGSGGGFSKLFPRPPYQDHVPGSGATRAVPDVAADADGSTGMAAIVDDGNGQSTLFGANGTSASTPLWAALIALANQHAGHDLGFVNPAIYRIGRSPAYHSAFHDITTGSNTVIVSSTTITGYPAGPGWDPVTGWGTPNASVLVPLLDHISSR